MCFRYVAVICYFISAKYNPKMDLKNIFFKNRQCLLIMTLFFPLKILHCPSFEKFLIFKCFWKKNQICRQYIFTLFLIIPLGDGHAPSFEEIKPILPAEHFLFICYTVACTL